MKIKKISKAACSNEGSFCMKKKSKALMKSGSEGDRGKRKSLCDFTWYNNAKMLKKSAAPCRRSTQRSEQAGRCVLLKWHAHPKSYAKSTVSILYR